VVCAAGGVDAHRGDDGCQGGGERYDNRDPRAWLESSKASRARQQRAAEQLRAFPFFAVAVIVAQMLQAPQDRVDALAVIFIAARVTTSAAISPTGTGPLDRLAARLAGLHLHLRQRA